MCEYTSNFFNQSSIVTPFCCKPYPKFSQHFHVQKLIVELRGSLFFGQICTTPMSKTFNFETYPNRSLSVVRFLNVTNQERILACLKEGLQVAFINPVFVCSIRFFLHSLKKGNGRLLVDGCSCFRS